MSRADVTSPSGRALFKTFPVFQLAAFAAGGKVALPDAPGSFPLGHVPLAPRPAVSGPMRTQDIFAAAPCGPFTRVPSWGARQPPPGFQPLI